MKFLTKFWKKIEIGTILMALSEISLIFDVFLVKISLIFDVLFSSIFSSTAKGMKGAIWKKKFGQAPNSKSKLNFGKSTLIKRKIIFYNFINLVDFCAKFYWTSWNLIRRTGKFFLWSFSSTIRGIRVISVDDQVVVSILIVFFVVLGGLRNLVVHLRWFGRIRKVP